MGPVVELATRGLCLQRSRVLIRYPVLPPKTVSRKWPIGASGTTGTVV